MPKGLFLPVACNKKICTPANAATTKGNTKCNTKKRVRVAFSTANPPHSHVTKLGPTYGNAEKRLVMTVAPQNLIWPQGNTYPINAAAITISNKDTPLIHVLINMYLP